jgi:hypothetical protein
MGLWGTRKKNSISYSMFFIMQCQYKKTGPVLQQTNIPFLKLLPYTLEGFDLTTQAETMPLDHAARQGDQIWRIFAQWAIVCFGQFLKNDRNSPQFWATLSKVNITY